MLAARSGSVKHRNNGKARIDDAKLEKVRKLKPSRPASSGKGALIKGMTKRLPSEILGNPLFREGLRSIMRGYAGIYALYRGDKLYYVGLTRNLFGRIRWHRRDRHARKWDSFVIFRIRRVNYLKDIETLLMQLVNTPGNRVKGKVPRDADINRVLRVILREETAEIRKIERALR
jgi:hypothetical protein